MSGMGAGLGGRNFWNGSKVNYTPIAVDEKLPYIAQDDASMCGKATGEMVLKAQGIEDVSQSDIYNGMRSLKSYSSFVENNLAIADYIAEKTGLSNCYSLRSNMGEVKDFITEVTASISERGSIQASLSREHSVAIKGVFNRVVTRVNGTVKSTRSVLRIFDPLVSTDMIPNIKYVQPNTMYNELHKIIIYGL